MRARRISLVNFKGGVGKTSLSVNLASCLAHDLGKTVLLVDCDAQSNASIWLMGVDRWKHLEGMPHKSVSGIFMPSASNVYHSIHHSPLEDENGVKLVPTLDLLPATYNLMDLEHEYQEPEQLPYYRKFYDEIGIFFDSYDYIIFDCPPNVFRATKCAVFASEEIYVPCNVDLLSYIGLALLVQKLTAFQNSTPLIRQHIPGYRLAEIRGIILNAIHRGASKSKHDQIIKDMRSKLINLRPREIVSDDADILDTSIGDYIAATRAVYEELPVTCIKGQSQLKEDYLNLAQYIDSHPLQPGARKNDTRRKTR